MINALVSDSQLNACTSHFLFCWFAIVVFLNGGERSVVVFIA